MNGIIGMLDISDKCLDNPEAVRKYHKKIRVASEYLLSLINDVLDMSKLEAGRLDIKEEPFDLAELMNEVAALMDSQVMQTGLVHRKHRGTIRHIALYGSSLQLRRIMLNLMSNSVKYNKPNGTIDTYATEISDDGETALYEFRIVDSGIGMSREFIENELFKPFTQEENDARTQYRGTGLGMSIVKALIDRLGGTIKVESTLGEGTDITYQLPLKIDKNASEQSESQNCAGVKNLEGMKILLVEDNEINMEIAEFYLTELGAKIDKAWNGKEALEKFEASEPHGYDVVLMDIMMPVMDGIEAVRVIRGLDREDAGTIPIFAMTAQASPENVRKCLNAGMDGHIPKPIEASKLGSTILKVKVHRS